jgi:cullin 1
VRIYVEIGMGSLVTYKRLEAAFLAATNVFYTRAASRWLQSDSCPQYLVKAEQVIEDETKRVRDYMDSSTQKELLGGLYNTLLVVRMDEVLGKENTGCKALLVQHAVEDLARIFRLYSVVPAKLEPIGAMVKAHVTEMGLALLEQVAAAKDYSGLVEEMLKLHDRYHELVRGCFGGHAVFQKALKDAFEAVINRPLPQATTAELLASYCDALLRKGGVKMADQALLETLEKVVRLFSYLLDKDLFSEFYRKQFAKRLLLQRSASTDAEQAMIGKLKVRCGGQFTSKFEGMLNDMRRCVRRGPCGRPFAP